MIYLKSNFQLEHIFSCYIENITFTFLFGRLVKSFAACFHGFGNCLCYHLSGWKRYIFPHHFLFLAPEPAAEVATPFSSEAQNQTKSDAYSENSN